MDSGGGVATTRHDNAGDDPPGGRDDTLEFRRQEQWNRVEGGSEGDDFEVDKGRVHAIGDGEDYCDPDGTEDAAEWPGDDEYSQAEGIRRCE